MSGTNFSGIVVGLLLFLGIAAYMSIGRDGAVEIINEVATYIPSLSKPGEVFGLGEDSAEDSAEEQKLKPRSTRPRRRASKSTEAPAPVPQPAYQ